MRENKVFVEGELDERSGTLTLRGLGQLPSALFVYRNQTEIHALGGRKFKLFILTYGDKGFGSLRPAELEDIKV